MAWILLEGLDRSGKSSVAEHYKEQGYEIIHMDAPDKKYFKEGYSGESYLEEIVRLYSSCEGKDVVFDRTIYGELIWPNVYGRLSMLTAEDIEYLNHMERNNESVYILMYDENTEAHWQRCVDNDEPLTRQQFGRANTFYNRLVEDYGFQKKQLTDFPEIMPQVTNKPQSERSSEISETKEQSHGASGNTDASGDSDASVKRAGSLRSEQGDSLDVGSIEDKLKRANAIRTLLSGKIVKKKGDVYEDIEQSIRQFLNDQLDEIFSPKPRGEELTTDEVVVLKQMVKRITDKMEK